MGFKKHGTGEVLSDKGEEVSKTSSNQQWQSSDEEALREEDGS